MCGRNQPGDPFPEGADRCVCKTILRRIFGISVRGARGQRARGGFSGQARHEGLRARPTSCMGARSGVVLFSVCFFTFWVAFLRWIGGLTDRPGLLDGAPQKKGTKITATEKREWDQLRSPERKELFRHSTQKTRQRTSRGIAYNILYYFPLFSLYEGKGRTPPVSVVGVG